MDESKFSIKEALTYGWQTTMANKGFFIPLLLVFYIVNVMPSILIFFLDKQMPILSIVVQVISWIISILMGLGFLVIMLRAVDQQENKISDLFTQWELLLPYVGVSILIGLAVMGGLILLIIPGVILAMRLQLAPYLLIDQNTSVMQSLNKSFALTKGYTWKLFCLYFLALLINFLGVLCLLVGVLITIPITSLALAFVYRKFVPRENPSAELLTQNN